MSYDLNESDITIIKHALSVFKHSQVTWAGKGSSYWDGDSKMMHISGAAHPSYSWENFMHELGHLLEIENDRTLNWNFTLPEQWIRGYNGYHHCVEPVTYQATMREIRACAYQRKVTEMSGQKYDLSFSDSLTYMPDFFLVPKLNEYSSEDDLFRDIDAYPQDKAQVAWIRKEVNAFYLNLTEEHIWSKWQEKINIISAA